MTATQPKSRQLLGINQQTYQALRASISLDLRRQLLIAVCDSVEMQAQIAAQLEQDVKQQIESERAGSASAQSAKSAMLTKPMDRLVFDADDGNLPQQIANWMRHTLFTVGDLPRLQVLGIEQMTRQPAITQNYFLRSLDKIEALLPQLNTSLLVWVPWPWLRTIQQSSSTFWNWRNGVFEFVSDPTPTPAKREALDIDVSMFEPEHEPQKKDSQRKDSSQSKETQRKQDANSTTSKSATLNGSLNRSPESSAVQNGQGHSNSQSSFSETTAKSQKTTPSVDLSNFFNLQKSASTKDANEAGKTGVDETRADESGANKAVEISPVASPRIEGATESETPKTEPMPLEFWDDDDFPVFDSDLAFDSDIESEAEKLDESDNSAAIDFAPVQIPFEEVVTQSVLPLSPETNEKSDSSEREARQAPKSPQSTDSQLEDGKASDSETQADETKEAPVSVPIQAASPEKAAVKQKRKKRRRNLVALGGLRSVVSQGVNVSSPENAATETLPNTGEKTTPEDDPAALLDALSKQAVSKQTLAKQAVNKPAQRVEDKAPTDYSSTEIPVLRKKTSDASTDQLLSTIVSKQLPEKAQLATDKQNSLASSTLQVVERSWVSSEETVEIESLPETSVTADSIPAEVGDDACSTGEAFSEQEQAEQERAEDKLHAAPQTEDTQGQAAQYFTEGLVYRSRIEAGEKELNVIEPAIAAYEKGLAYLRDSHPDRITGLNDLGTLYWLKAQRQSEQAEAIACMKKSIQHYREALESSSNSTADESTQLNIIGQLHSNMGAVFTMLATCEDPVSHLMQAAESYQEALPMVPLAQNPEEYATLYNSLGSVYWKLSHYESVELYLHQAIVAYTEALLGYKPEQQPLDYAAVQNNLGITYWSLAKHEEPETLLKQAIAAYRDALNYRTSDVDPAACAISYNNLALAYWDLSKHTHSDLAQKSRYQKNAITAFEAALNINNLSGALSPMDSAAIYHCLGDVHAQMTETAPSTIDTADSLQKSLYSYIKSIENLSTDSPAYPPRFGAIIANLRLHYDKLGLEGQQNALNRIPSTLLPQVMMAL